MNIQQVDEATRRLVEVGVRVLSPFMLGDSEVAHVDRLLQWLRPPTGARILDAGSGTGEVARLMFARRPDLSFTLLNVSRYQLSLSPDWARQVCASFEATGEPAGFYDLVLFSQSIEHAEDLAAVLCEAARVTRRGGCVAIFGMADRGGDMQRMRATLSSHARTVECVVDAAVAAGMVLESEAPADGWAPIGNRLVTAPDFEAAFAGVSPHFWRFTNVGPPGGNPAATVGA